MCSKPFVIVIAGSVGSGKSTVATNLSESLPDAALLIFDDYEAFIQFPEDMQQWMRDGYPPQYIRVPELQEDMIALRNGKPITHPLSKNIIQPGKFIILEEPSGRERLEIRDKIDLVVFIDVPQDICVLRMIQRVLDMKYWQENGTFENSPTQDLVRQLDTAALWVKQYQNARSMYMSVSEIVKQSADLIVDGLKPVEEISSEILGAIGQLN
ncbi:MAG: hypothetical protein JEZ06_11655 [Anaerolineaceae bacterium]|nr:hypothetical protein [Anaerolineaceae bacterium]